MQTSGSSIIYMYILVSILFRDTPTHLFTEWYLFVAAPILIVLVTGVFIHYSTVAIPVGESVIDESSMYHISQGKTVSMCPVM